jgi:hypothetical protein
MLVSAAAYAQVCTLSDQVSCFIRVLYQVEVTIKQECSMYVLVIKLDN